jgi:hypothetical protein
VGTVSYVNERYRAYDTEHQHSARQPDDPRKPFKIDGAGALVQAQAIAIRTLSHKKRG